MGMKDIAKKSAEKANQKLARREKELLDETTIDWEVMRPEIGSESDYKLLMDVVREATIHNESVGSVLERLEKFGSEGIALAKKIRGLISV